MQSGTGPAAGLPHPWSAGILPACSLRLSAVLLPREISILLLGCASRGMPAELDEANLVNLVNFFRLRRVSYNL